MVGKENRCCAGEGDVAEAGAGEERICTVQILSDHKTLPGRQGSGNDTVENIVCKRLEGIPRRRV